MSRTQPKKCASAKQQILWSHLSSSGYGDRLPKKTQLPVSNSLKPEKIIKDSSVVRVCSFFEAATNTFPINEGKNRMRLSYPRTSMINACPFSFDVFFVFFPLILFDSTIISFLVFPPSICHLWRWWNDTKTSNHIFYVITFHLIIFPLFPPSPPLFRTARREAVSYLFPQWIR